MAKYAYFWGCYIPSRLPHMEKSTRAVFDNLGIDVVDLDGLTCCPEKSMIRNMNEHQWLLTAARNLSLVEEAGRTFVTPCTGCFGTLKGAAMELRSDPALRAEVNQELARIGRRYQGAGDVVHMLDLLYQDLGPGWIRERIKYPMAGMRIAIHYGCHLVRPSKELLFDDPFWPTKFDQLVEALGAESVAYHSKMQCCGNLLLRAGEEKASHFLCRAKLRDVMEVQADALVLVCPSCMMQYDNVQYLLQRAGEDLNVPILYYPELLGLALGLKADELGLDRHRVAIAPFIEKWQTKRARLEEVKKHWDFSLLRACAECGACVEDCPVAQADPSYHPNALIRALAASDLKAVLHSPALWKCIECYTCAELCPNKYDQMRILRIAKHLAIELGIAPSTVLEGMQSFRKTGRLTQASVAQRRRLGLPPVPPAPVDELRALLELDETKEKPHV